MTEQPTAPYFTDPNYTGAVGPGQYFGRSVPRPNDAAEVAAPAVDPGGTSASEFGYGPEWGTRAEPHALPGEFAPPPHELRFWETKRLMMRTDAANPHDGVQTLSG
jgi:hypothetical protein